MAVIEWLVICSFFAWRFFRFRKAISLAIVTLCLGWLVLSVTASLQWQIAAVFEGVLIWLMIIRTQREGG